MNVEFMCGLLANYSKELSEAETYREKGDVQLKHANLILNKVKNCSIPAVSGQSEQLKAFLDEIANDKTYILNNYYKNKAKRLSKSL